MTDIERMQEKIDFYCDADRRLTADKELVEKHSPTIEEVLDVLADAAA